MPMYLSPSCVCPDECSALDPISHDISVTIAEPSIHLTSGYKADEGVDSYEDNFNSPSHSSTRSSPFPESFFLDHCRSDLLHIVPQGPTMARDAAIMEEQQANKTRQLIHQSFTSPACFQSSERDSTSPITSEGSSLTPVSAVGKRIRHARSGKIMKETKFMDELLCHYCKNPFTRDRDAERHQVTCKLNPNCTEKEKCGICGNPLPVRPDARRRHWGTSKCVGAARKQLH